MIIKEQKEILDKLGISELNAMQQKAHAAIEANPDTVLLSPTGTGKTLAFLLPLVKGIDPTRQGVQVLILVPSRELAIQIEQVTREMGSGHKANAVYGGRAFSKDKLELSHPPAILVGTPGRVADHLRRQTFDHTGIKTLVLDEFDKSLEVGFEDEMKEIINTLDLEKRILTSATQEIGIPDFTGVRNPVTINFLEGGTPQLKIRTIIAPEKDKLSTLLKLLAHTGDGQGIIFCNFRDSIQEVSNFLSKNKISHGCFSGGMEQKDRERALIKFRNGTSRILLATDLAARGIDIPEIKFIVHYQLPHKAQEFTHRNGRTARMQQSGTAYVIQWEKEELPEFISANTCWEGFSDLPQQVPPKQSKMTTLFLSGGRKDKISKGDIAGLFIKQGGLSKEQLGVIELKQECAFVGVPSARSVQLVLELNNSRLKKKKIRVTSL